jgi:hypothetical protein
MRQFSGSADIADRSREPCPPKSPHAAPEGGGFIGRAPPPLEIRSPFAVLHGFRCQFVVGVEQLYAIKKGHLSSMMAESWRDLRHCLRCRSLPLRQECTGHGLHGRPSEPGGTLPFTLILLLPKTNLPPPGPTLISRPPRWWIPGWDRCGNEIQGGCDHRGVGSEIEWQAIVRKRGDSAIPRH